jgi:UDP-N-acetylmuramate dehydrogenase
VSAKVPTPLATPSPFAVPTPIAPAKLARDVPLAPLTTLGLGGRARALIEIDSDASLVEALRFARESRVPIFVLGGGSNVVIADAGFPGLVLRMASRGVTLEPEAVAAADGDRVRVRAAAGEPWDALVARTVAEGLAGIECLSGIPGLVGSTPIQNVGAYGQEVADAIVEVEVLDRDTLARATLGPSECRFAYRHSLFKEPAGAGWIVTAVTFALRRGAPGPVRYGELAKALAAHGGVNDVRGIREEVLALRRAKSMVWDPEDPNRRSAGSFFTNPIVPRALAERLVDDAVATGLVRFREEVPVFAAPDLDGAPRAKLSAGWLIERAGFERGLRRGAVGLSTKHALCLVHHGGGQAAELVAFARLVADGVASRFGVRLAPEPVFVGFDAAF